jgi:hypothetical protein
LLRRRNACGKGCMNYEIIVEKAQKLLCKVLSLNKPCIILHILLFFKEIFPSYKSPSFLSPVGKRFKKKSQEDESDGKSPNKKIAESKIDYEKGKTAIDILDFEKSYLSDSKSLKEFISELDDDSYQDESNFAESNFDYYDERYQNTIILGYYLFYPICF